MRVVEVAVAVVEVADTYFEFTRFMNVPTPYPMISKVLVINSLSQRESVPSFAFKIFVRHGRSDMNM
jgi:hypothetical protein